MRVRFIAPSYVVRRSLLLLLLSVSVACAGADAKLQSEIERQLAADPMTAPLKLSVEVKRGQVYIDGQTTTVTQQRRALDIARSTKGVVDVKHQMTIPDEVVVKSVKEALAADPLLAAVPIDVDARNGFVRLMSDQTDRTQRERAVALVRSIDGVTDVEDRMK